MNKDRSSESDVFGHLIDLLSLSQPTGLVAMIDAFLDAGKDKDERVLTVAVVAYGGENAKKAHRRWKAIWGDTICHMTDLHNGKGQFQDWTREQVRAKFEPSVAVLNRRATYRVAVSCNITEYTALAPRTASKEGEPYMGAYGSAYGFCCHMAMASLAEIVQKNGDHDGVNYVLESGDEHQGALRNFIYFAESIPILRTAFGIRSHIVAEKKDARLLEGADILAWEWNKHILREPNDDRVRKSLQVLLGSSREQLLRTTGLLSPPGYALHYSGEAVAESMSGISTLIASGPAARSPS